MMVMDKGKLIVTKTTRKENTGAGMALVLIMLILGIFTQVEVFLTLAAILLVINMLNSKAFYPFALLWYSLSNLLGRIVSSILLTAVYFIMLMPVALIQKLARKDKLNIKQFKKSSESVFITRNHLYIKSDLENPY